MLTRSGLNGQGLFYGTDKPVLKFIVNGLIPFKKLISDFTNTDVMVNSAKSRFKTQLYHIK